MPVVIVRKAPHWQELHQVDRPAFLIGRDDDCQLILGDPSVSRRHAVIAVSADGCTLEDLGSRNGTRVNGQPIQRAALHDGDTLLFGAVAAEYLEQAPDRLALDREAPEHTYLFPPEHLADDSPRLQMLYQIAAAARGEEDAAAVIDRALAHVARALAAENVYLGLMNGDRIDHHFFQAEPQSGAAFVLSRTIVDRVLASGKALLLGDAAAASEFRARPSVVTSRAKSVLCAPLQISGRLRGVLYADTRSVARPFKRQDLAFVGVVGVMLASLLRSLDTITDLRAANRALQEKLAGDDLLGESSAMNQVRDLLRRYAAGGDAPVLVTGESGTGKELAARLVHRWSARADQPFIAVNCAALPKDLLESELFGHTKGAFTGATADRLGLLQMADSGMLFLDEIGEMPLELQTKLLRVLESGEFRAVGGGKAVRVDVRIVAATNRDLAQAMKERAFRADLFYRLAVLQVRMPALREHPEDIGLLAERFLQQQRAAMKTNARRFSPTAVAQLHAYPWPGNVRQLKNAVTGALYACDAEEIQAEHLPGLVEDADEGEAEPGPGPAADAGPLTREIEALEVARIRAALERHRWKRSATAAELGVSRQTLLNKIKKYNL